MENIIPKRTARLLIILLDVLFILISYSAAFYIVSHFRPIDARNIDAFISIIPWILLIGICFLYVFELDRLVQRNQSDLVKKLIVASASIMVLTVAASFIFREFALPRSVILLAHIFIFGSLFFWKSFFLRMNTKKFRDKAVFIGCEEEFEMMQGNLISSKMISKDTGVTLLNPDQPLNQMKLKIQPFNFIFIGSSLNEEVKNDILYFAMKQKKFVYMIPNTNDLFIMKTSFTTVGDTMVLQVKPFTLSNAQTLLKRALDVSVSLILLLLTLPVMVLTAILIKLEDGGPFFFKQERVGMDQRPFHILKFRSMIMDAEAKTGPTLATSQDARITKIGAFIRRTRIDELPQLLNVLRGDMSLVGPRPERDFFAKQFEKENKWFYYRNSVKPGITGYAQVLGNYTTSPERKLKFDLYYIRHYSIWLDIVLLFRTVLVVLNKSQAEGQAEKLERSLYKSKKGAIVNDR
ncbi:sugar transferase [Alkalihalophilus sp. As8PL]|uniref:Sugar transferase n=1 Tax=Alkalihalophilus sp. As8PL TaxID=3237103 RepID=A0AB39BQ09_9BACI